MEKKSDKKNKPLSESEFQKVRAEIKQRLAMEKAEMAAEGEQKIKVEAEVEEPVTLADKKSWSDKTRDFSALYRGGKHSKVDMTKIERRDPNRKKKIIGWTIFILVIILAAALAGFYFFINQEDKFSGEKVDIEIQQPLSIVSGDEIDFSIVIYNREEIDLVEAELTLQFPADFTFISSSPAASNEANNAWQLGEIKKGSSKTVKVTGRVFGELKSTKNFVAILSYVPANFLSEFQKRQSFSFDINDSILDLDLEMPSKVISSYKSDYKIIYINNSDEAIQRVRLVLTLPEDLEASDFNPSLSNEETVWEIDELVSGARQEISFQGILSAEEGAMREVKVQLGYVDENGEFFIQVEKTSIIFVINPQLLLTLTINNTTKNNVVSLGETLNYTINYQNESQSEIKNMSVVVKLEGEAIDWESLVDVNEGEVADQQITWDQSKIDNLSSVKPGDQGEINFSIDLLDSILADDQDDINYYLTSQATALSAEVVDLEGSSLEVKSEEITTKINSLLDLRAEGRYYNDEYLAVGSGPIPPEVGETTQYQIYWYLKNGANEVSQVEVSAQLPEGVSWVNDIYFSAGNLSYDSATGQVTWSINRMPEHVGQFIAELEARFAVEVTPTTSDLGKLLILLGKSQVVADDTFTEQEISLTQDMITSDLTTDPLATDKGLVVQGSSPTNTNTNTNSN